MPEVFTHAFEFKVGDEEIKGKIKFSSAEEPVMSLEGSVQSLKMTQAFAFSECMRHLGKLFKAFGSIESIEINAIAP